MVQNEFKMQPRTYAGASALLEYVAERVKNNQNNFEDAYLAMTGVAKLLSSEAAQKAA